MERASPGLAEGLCAPTGSRTVCPMAILSRGIAGIAGTYSHRQPARVGRGGEGWRRRAGCTRSTRCTGATMPEPDARQPRLLPRLDGRALPEPAPGRTSVAYHFGLTAHWRRCRSVPLLLLGCFVAAVVTWILARPSGTWSVTGSGVAAARRRPVDVPRAPRGRGWSEGGCGRDLRAAVDAADLGQTARSTVCLGMLPMRSPGHSSLPPLLPSSSRSGDSSRRGIRFSVTTSSTSSRSIVITTGSRSTPRWAWTVDGAGFCAIRMRSARSAPSSPSMGSPDQAVRRSRLRRLQAA